MTWYSIEEDIKKRKSQYDDSNRTSPHDNISEIGYNPFPCSWKNEEDSTYFSNPSTTDERTNIFTRMVSRQPKFSLSGENTFLFNELEKNKTSVDSLLDESNASLFNEIEEEFATTSPNSYVEAPDIPQGTLDNYSGRFDCEETFRTTTFDISDVSYHPHEAESNAYISDDDVESTQREGNAQNWQTIVRLTSNITEENMKINETDDPISIAIEKMEKHIRCQFSNPIFREKPWLSYIAPIFQRDYTDEEKDNARDIRNVVTRRYGRQFQELTQRVNKSLHGLRFEKKEVNPEKDFGTLNGSHLTQLLTIPSKIGGKFRARINELIDEEKRGELLGTGTLDAVFERSIEDDNDEVNSILDQQDTIITQATKALNLCNNDDRFDRSNMWIEVERIILKATATKDIIETHKRIGRYEDPEDKSGFLHISNLNISLEKLKERDNSRTHYLCILHCGKTIYCSNLIYVKKGKKLKLPDTYHFSNLSCDLKIGVRIYVIHSRARRTRSIFKFIKNCGMLLKSLLICSTSQEVSECNGNHFFELCGEFSITRDKLKPKEFLLRNIEQKSHVTGELRCDIESGVDLKYQMISYLLICRDECEGIWIRQWCKLEGAKLKFWDNSDDKDEPKITIDLSRSLVHRIQYADRCIHSRNKSLHLKMKSESPRRNILQEDIYLSCEDEGILSNWKITLNIVLYNLRNWGELKCP